MALLWALAAVAAAAGAGLLLVQVRVIAGAADDLRDQLVRLDEVRAAVAQVRADAGHCGQALGRVRSRPGAR